MSATSSDNEAVLEAKADVLSPPLEGRRNVKSTKRKLIFDGASSKTVDCSSPRGDHTPSPFRASCPVNLHFPLSFMCTSSLAELFPRFVTPEKKFMEAMSMDGRTVLHAEPRHAPASPYSLICGAGVESSKGSTDILEDEFEFLDWYIASDLVSLLPLPNNVEHGVGRDWFLPVIHRESKLTPEHMDSIMYLLVLDLEPHEAPRVRNWTFLDFNCWSEELVKVYDPVSTEVSPSHMKDTFFSLSYHLPELFEEAGIGTSVPRAHRLRVVKVKSPQLARYCDGGFMVFDYLKCLVSGASVQRANPSNCNHARLHYCVSLFKFGLEWLVRFV
ncbi:hypothetical protein C2S52_007232 [Perilla frutescens var. hirtella]|nr:hypothetical protein C2S52_007232 [Perilla frutescens var. hirtella]